MSAGDGSSTSDWTEESGECLQTGDPRNSGGEDHGVRVHLCLLVCLQSKFMFIVYIGLESKISLFFIFMSFQEQNPVCSIFTSCQRSEFMIIFYNEV